MVVASFIRLWPYRLDLTLKHYDITIAGVYAPLWTSVWVSALAASVLRAFEGEIAKLGTLAVLMPIVASLGGNAGTQALAVAVRALASKELSSVNAYRTVFREMAVGLANGAALAAVIAAQSAALPPPTMAMS